MIYNIDLRNPNSFFVMQSFAINDKDVMYVSNAGATELQKFLNLILSVAYPALTGFQVFGRGSAQRRHSSSTQSQAMSQVTSSSLIAAVAALPEIYQPIYGHEELSGKVSRRCVDRLAHIVQVHEAMKRRLQRPLKVLDLGCSQGFFSCSLAAQGAQVVGIDHTAQNIRVCEELARESPSLQLEFVHGSVEDFIAALTPGRFDLVLGLSVFHHIVHERGIGFVTDLLGRLSELVEVGVFEMALPTEGPYWSASQSTDPRKLLDSYSFVLEVGKVETHLSQERRPIYAASRTLAVLGEEAFRFDEVRTQSHALADNTHVGTRRYYFSNSTVIKLFRVDGAIADHNRAELEGESDFLATHGEALPFLPRLLAHGTGPAEAWLVREKLPGRLLMDLIADGSVFDGQTLVADVLEQATALESLGLYHGDLRTWNVLVDPDDRAVLIDYGAIKHTRADNVWPDDVFLAFFVFLHEVAHRRVVRVLPVRAPFISPFNLPFPYRELAAWLWELPAGSWSFAGLKDRWTVLTSSPTSATVASGNGMWQAAVERYLLALADAQDEGRSTHGQLRGALETHRRDSAGQSSALESAIRELSESSVAHGDELDELRRLNSTHVSRFEQGERLLATLEADAAQADARRADLDAELGRLALRLDAADASKDAARAGLETSIEELRKHVERHLIEVQTAVRAEHVMVDALTEQFETLKRFPWRLWWPGTKRVSPFPLGRPERAENGARPTVPRSTLDAPAIVLVAPKTPVLPSEVSAMRSEEASDGKGVCVQPDDEKFVSSAYRMILGREADSEGLGHYVRQLERGAERWEGTWPRWRSPTKPPTDECCGATLPSCCFRQEGWECAVPSLLGQ